MGRAFSRMQMDGRMAAWLLANSAGSSAVVGASLLSCCLMKPRNRQTINTHQGSPEPKRRGDSTVDNNTAAPVQHGPAAPLGDFRGGGGETRAFDHLRASHFLGARSSSMTVKRPPGSPATSFLYPHLSFETMMAFMKTGKCMKKEYEKKSCLQSVAFRIP